MIVCRKFVFVVAVFAAILIDATFNFFIKKFTVLNRL